jgi:hypothetical protein
MNNNIIEKEFLNSKPLEPAKPTKEDLQIKKLQLQIEALEEKKKIQQQKQEKASKLQTTKSILKGLIGICALLLAPFIILGGFLLACAKAAK